VPPPQESEIGFSVEPANLHVFDAKTEERIDA
jgi:hypothetical protein